MRVGAIDEDRAPTSRLSRMICLVSLLLLGACASPGPPRPPSLNLPEVVSTFTAERVGDQVQLHWTTPEKTTDGIDVRGPMNAAICRRPVVSPAQACTAVLRLPVAAGPSEAVDRLPSPLSTGPTVAVEYRLEILNARRHSAGESAAAFAAGGSAPPGLERLQAAASNEGTVLTWQREDGRDEVELQRVTVTAGNIVKKTSGVKASDISNLVLRVPPDEGALDRTAHLGERYTYRAQRVRIVHVGGHNLEIRSAVSTPVTVEMRDVFPPRRPIGLEAVAGDHVVDLSWEPSTESDLAGYLVLRQETDAPAQLTSASILEPSFQDKSAVPGHSYRYTVVAMDKAGNRSPASEPASVSVRADVP